MKKKTVNITAEMLIESEKKGVGLAIKSENGYTVADLMLIHMALMDSIEQALKVQNGDETSKNFLCVTRSGDE